MIPPAPEAGPSTMCSLSMTASTPAASASTAMRTSERRSRGEVSVQFSLRTRISRGGTTLSVEVGHHVLDARVVLEAVHREILAIAGALEAAVGHLGDERDVRVDPDAAEVEPARDAHGTAVIRRPDRRREAVLDAVGPLHGLVLVAERLHRDDRPEDLVLDQVVVLAQVRDHRRLVEEPGPGDSVPAGCDVPVARDGFDHGRDALVLVGVVERPEEDVLVVGH